MCIQLWVGDLSEYTTIQHWLWCSKRSFLVEKVLGLCYFHEIEGQVRLLFMML